MNDAARIDMDEGVSAAEGHYASLPLLADLPPSERTRVIGVAKVVRAEAGDVIMKEGTPGDGLYFVLSGELEVTRKEGRQEVVLAVHAPGAFVGEMSLVEDTLRTATVRAATSTELLVIPPEEFRLLLRTSPAAALTILRTVLGRLKSTEASLLQHAKLASLGTLAAGLAHEINNPAAAVRRGIGTLGESLAAAEHASRELARVAPLAAANRPSDPIRAIRARDPDPIIRAEEEERLADWLSGRGVERGYELAEALVACGWDATSLGGVIDGYASEGATRLLEWLGWTCASRIVLDEAGRATEVISEIVGAVRAYAFLDQAPVQDVDVVQTIENTLVILRSRLHHGVKVSRRYAPDLPRVPALGVELTQLWTSLIDNAIDAMKEVGDLEIVVEREGNDLAVRVIDNGPGIPDAILPRIFEPFFTTKGPGEGSGIGLHVSYAVVRRHDGRITVSSRPGRTEFKVVLPLSGVDAED